MKKEDLPILAAKQANKEKIEPDFFDSKEDRHFVRDKSGKLVYRNLSSDESDFDSDTDEHMDDKEEGMFYILFSYGCLFGTSK